MSDLTNPLPLAQALIRRASVTPVDDGALAVLEQALGALGFVCRRLPFGGDGRPEIQNLYARRGTASPNFCFAGHTDVVPPGAGWSADPFAGEVRDGWLFGRGAADMKGAIACFISAVARLLRDGETGGSISLLITGDEEGPAQDGTIKVLHWLAEQGESLDACLVGEPTNPNRLGEMIKIGRRGSLNGRLTVHGTQGHAAYPHLADNPIPRLMRMLAALTDQPLDDGTEHFQPSSLALTTVDVGNKSVNVIPAQASAGFNIRFNDLHSGASLEKWLIGKCKAVGGRFDLTVEVSGEAFLTPPGPLSEGLVQAIATVTGITPELSTSGGTSDARFIRCVCPVAEFGLVGQTMHKADERVAVADLETLTEIYHTALRGFLPRSC